MTIGLCPGRQSFARRFQDQGRCGGVLKFVQKAVITNKGLTIIDLGDAPLSVGHLSEVAAAPGVQIVMRAADSKMG